MQPPLPTRWCARSSGGWQDLVDCRDGERLGGRVPRDVIEDSNSWLRRPWRRLKASLRVVGRAREGFGLSAKLLLLTFVFVMLAEVLIFVPSVANFRIAWLSERLTASRLAAL